MNTVGRRAGSASRSAASSRSSMLTEGWDANTVTHILGLRAFGTKLICEQVIGRALRRLCYDLPTPTTGLFRVEYADIMGIDGLNFAAQDAVTRHARRPRARWSTSHAVPRTATRSRSASPASRATASSSPTTAIAADFSKIEPYVLDPREGRRHCEIKMRGIVGAPETLTLEHLDRMRRNEIIFKLDQPPRLPQAPRRRRPPESPP